VNTDSNCDLDGDESMMNNDHCGERRRRSKMKEEGAEEKGARKILELQSWIIRCISCHFATFSV